MRKLPSALAAGVLTLSMVGSAQASMMGWEGTLQLDFRTLRSMVFTHESGTFGGAGVTLNGSSGLGHLSTIAIPAQDVRGLGGRGLFSLTDPGNPTLISIHGSPTGTGLPQFRRHLHYTVRPLRSHELERLAP